MIHHLLILLVIENCSPQPYSSYPPCMTGTNSSSPWIDCILKVQPLYDPLPTISVKFTTSDNKTQVLFAHAETCEAGNTLEITPGFDVLVEGGHYNAVWLETQPMGGAMYGVRNLRLALNNQLIFIRTQRSDGRLPGMITKGKTAESATIHPTYSYPGNPSRSMLQGFYMATPAVDVAWLMNRSNTIGPDTDAPVSISKKQQYASVLAYLNELETALIRFESWLWAARNSSHGVLWLEGTADTGEDNSDKYKSIPGNQITPPFESMDMMGYAHDAQRALARIAKIKRNEAAQAKWKKRMASTAAALKKRLWREEFGACFDRERDGNQSYVSTLVHNNIRAMWHGVFSQEMADTFIQRHLMNTSKFWTLTPLTSIAASDPRFKNTKGNNWSGPPEGLTFQRAIRALEHYGHHAEIVMVGVRQKQALFNKMIFPQQIDPFTSIPDSGSDCYGPMLLSMLEYAALTTGIIVRPESESILWSNINTGNTAKRENVEQLQPVFTFTQQLGSHIFILKGLTNGTFFGIHNGIQLFECSGNTRVVTDVDTGVVTAVVGASSETTTVHLWLPGIEKVIKLSVAPNEEWSIKRNGESKRIRKVPFTMPF